MALWSDIETKNRTTTVELAGRQYNFKKAEVGNFIPMGKCGKTIGKKNIAIHGSFAGKVKIVIATLALLAALAVGANHIFSNPEPEPVTNPQVVTIQTIDGDYVKVPQAEYDKANEQYLKDNPEPNIPDSAPDSYKSPMEDDIYPSFVRRR